MSRRATACVEAHTHVVHLVRNKLQPILPALDPRNHLRQPRAHDRLSIERLAERDALRGPLEALLDRPALRGEACADDHPALVVEVAEDDLHAVADLAERVRDGRAGAVERHVGGPGGRGVCSLDGFGEDGVLAGNEDDRVAVLEDHGSDN